MDLVDPDPSIGRHGIDIRTILCPDGSIQVYSTNMLVDCEDYFQWSASLNCTLDIAKEECVGFTGYDGNFSKKYWKQIEEKWIGRKIEGLSELVETLCKCHKEFLKVVPRYTAVGWDCMKTDQGWVIFEGNLSRERLDTMYFSFAQAFDFVYNFSWPFDTNR